MLAKDVLGPSLFDLYMLLRSEVATITLESPSKHQIPYLKGEVI